MCFDVIFSNPKSGKNFIYGGWKYEAPVNSVAM